MIRYLVGVARIGILIVVLAAEAHGAIESILVYHLDADRVVQEGI